MNNDLLYLVATTSGFLLLMLALASKKALNKMLFFSLMSLFFVQSGICVYKGLNGIHLKRAEAKLAIPQIKISNQKVAIK